MNAFYLVTDFIRKRLSENPNVNTVVFARTDEKDLYKKNIYPIAHINPIEAPFTSSKVNTFSFEVGVFDQRDISNDLVIDKFEGNDNVQDNLNITYMILDDLVRYVRDYNNDLNIELASVTAAKPLLFTDINILDGWVITITLKIPNTQC